MRPEERPSPIDLAHEGSFRLGALEVRPATREVISGGTRQVIEPRVMQVLVVFAHRRGEVVSRDDLIALCWGGRAVSEDAIDRCIGALRRLAEALDGFSIETIPRVGYRLTAQPAPGRATQPRGHGLHRLLRERQRLFAAALMVLLLIGGLATWFTLHRPERPRDVSDVRVAVLPFDALSPGSETAYFAASLRGEIVSALARNQVRVIPRQDSLALEGAGRGAAARRLGVGLLLAGTVERVGDTLRVRLHLEDPKDKTTLWSRSFDGPASDPLLAQSRAAGRATDVIGWLLSSSYGLGAPIDRATLAAYLEAGDEIQNQGGDRYLRIFRQVVARAPDFSYGHSGLSFALARAAMSGPPADRARLMAEAQAEGRVALRLDPHNGEGYAILAISTPPAWAEREQLLRRGLAADPTGWAAQSGYAMFLADTGRAQEALALHQRALAAAPYWARGRAILARRLADAGRLEEGRGEIERTARLWPDDLDVVRVQSELAAEAAPAAARSQLLDGRGAADPRLVVAALAKLGDTNGAFAAAERLRTAGDLFGYQDATSVLFAPVTAPLRRDQRFMPLAARLGLLAYWRRSGHWPDFCREPGLPYDCARS
jgi:DNA-binding winged helix-turn-helix (wHTH) protein/TolB-like protein